MDIPILQTLSSFTDNVIDLKRVLVNKGLIDSNSKFYLFAEKVALTETQIVPVSFKLGPVKNIRFSIIDNLLNICYEDPDNIVVNEVVVARHGTTTLRAKLGSYPTSHTDGIEILSETHKNRYLQNPFSVDLDSLGLINEGQEIYFSFFCATAVEEVWNDDADLPYNKFTSSSYDWNMIYGALKDFPNSRNIGILPEPGSVVYIDYILSDYYLNGTTKVPTNTRLAVVDNIEKISSVSIPFKVLGYNANVPQYVPYRRYDNVNDTYEYIYVQAVDDAVSAVDVYDINDDYEQTLSIDIGTKQFRLIAAGARVYAEDTWNLTANIKSYSYTGKNVAAASLSVFGYDNEGTGKLYVYNVPISLTVDNVQYGFCGYTMTMQPVDCLGSVASDGTWYAGCLFDAPENTYATPFNVFPSNYHSDAKYYTMQADGLHEVDWSSYASQNVNELTDDVYLLEDNLLKLLTVYYERYHKYCKHDIDAGTYLKMVEIFDFQEGEVYYPNCEPKNYDASYNLSVYADIVRHNGLLYICKALTPDGNTKTPAELTACFRALSSAAELSVKDLYDAGHYFIVGKKIPATTSSGEEIVEMNILNRNSYGSNIYEESFCKLYANNINGSRTSTDSPYKKMNKFDNISTSGMAGNCNSLMLKLYKEQNLIRHICPAANRTVLSLKNFLYRKHWQWTTSGHAYNSGRWETSIDLFWPLAYYEVFGSGADASSTFSTVYSDNASRIKKTILLSGANGTAAVHWWIRHPNTVYTHTEHDVNTSGAASSHIASNTNGFCHAFIIC